MSNEEITTRRLSKEEVQKRLLKKAEENGEKYDIDLVWQVVEDAASAGELSEATKTGEKLLQKLKDLKKTMKIEEQAL